MASTAQIITTGREALRRAWHEIHGVDPSEQALRTWTAQILFESRFGREGSMVGTNNPGAWNASADFKKAHANDPTYGEFYHLDHDAQGNPRRVPFRIYPHQLAAARAWVRAWADEANAYDPYAYAASMYARHYFTGTEGTDQERINAYARAIIGRRGEVDSALAKGLAPEDPSQVDPPAPTLNKFVTGWTMYGGKMDTTNGTTKTPDWVPPVIGGALIVGTATLLAFAISGDKARGAARENPLRKCPTGSKVQTLLFSRPLFTPSRAKAWARSHGYKSGKVDITDRFVRLRQRDPGGFRRLRTITLGAGVKAVVGWRRC